MEPLRGSCLRFELTEPFRRASFCHCSRCRKHSGTFGLTQGRVPRAGFLLLAGDDLIRIHRADGGMTKAFCSVCGSSLIGGTWPNGPEISVRLGALDDDPGIRPQYRSHTASAAVWDAIPDDGLPHYPGPAPAS